MTGKPRSRRAPKPVVEDEIVDAEIVDDDLPTSPGTGLAVREQPRTLVATAVGDTIYLQMLQNLVGWGAAGTIIQVVETPYIDAMIANGFAVIVTAPTPTPTPGTPTSIQWQPFTLYPAGWEVFAPDGRFVRRLTTGVSGATFDGTQWTVVNDVGGGLVKAVAGHAPDATGNVPLAASDVGADVSGAAAAAQSAAAADATSKVNALGSSLSAIYAPGGTAGNAPLADAALTGVPTLNGVPVATTDDAFVYSLIFGG